MDVVLASCLHLPEPDFDSVPLERAIADRGLSVEVRGWDDPAARWDDARIVALRATWNYPEHPRAFAGWVAGVSKQTTLLNDPDVVRWNVHKRYLLDLEAAGVPTTPTEVLPAGASDSLRDVLLRRGWDDVVVKPAISAASFKTMHVTPRRAAEGEAHLRSLLAERDVLIQPYLRSVEGHGERALVWVDGQLTHSVRKTPRWDGEDESVSTEAMPISKEERAVAEQAVEAALRHGDLLYARIDVAPGPDGTPVVMELELIEPSLFFPQGPAALTRYVDALERRLRATRMADASTPS